MRNEIMILMYFHAKNIQKKENLNLLESEKRLIEKGLIVLKDGYFTLTQKGHEVTNALLNYYESIQ